MCAHFQDGLDPRLLTGFHRNFPQHSVVQSLNAANQWKVLQEMLQAAQQAEDDFLMITWVSHEAVGLSQAFHATATGGGSPASAIAGAYFSQAKMTMKRYACGSSHSTSRSATTASGGGRGKRFFSCHSCGRPHPWTEFCKGQHIVVCPNRDNPGMHKNAKKNVDRMKANLQKRFKKNSKRKNLGPANFADFDKAGQQRIREQGLQAMGNCKISNATSVASSVTTPSSIIPSASAARGQGGGGRGFQVGGGRVFVIDVQVLAAGSALKQMMPIAIHSNLPHIVM